MSEVRTYKCQFCGFEFSEKEAESACSSCPISSCEKLCCPNCGYEHLPEPKLIKLLRDRRKRKIKEANL
ncbi:MAG: hypothetical protein JSV56_09010 [Methanomassiliicoccales archaeon]|nr:MAG: hypothetical protein JSV56_09010 [Methanomassiliicoccales archaeon]